MMQRAEKTGDAMLSRRTGVRSWRKFLALMRTIDIPDDFMADRPMNAVPQEGRRPPSRRAD